MFKIGDKVRLISAGYGAKVGATAVVTKESYTDPWGGLYIRVCWDRTNPLCGIQSDGGGYCVKDFVLDTPALDGAKAPLDLTKHVQTVAGEPVTVISTEGRGGHSILGYIGGSTKVSQWTRRGTHCKTSGDYTGNSDLVNVPEPKPEPVELDARIRLHMHRHKETGKVRIGAKHRPNSKVWERIAYKDFSVTLTEGEGL